MKFYKAEIGTPLYDEYGEDLIPDWKVASPEYGNERRKYTTYPEPEDIAKVIRNGNNEGYDEMDLYACLCEMADMLDEWENSEDEWECVADKAAEKLGVKI